MKVHSSRVRPESLKSETQNPDIEMYKEIKQQRNATSTMHTLREYKNAEELYPKSPQTRMEAFPIAKFDAHDHLDFAKFNLKFKMGSEECLG